MAYLQLIDGKSKHVSESVGNRIWSILTGTSKPTPDEEKLADITRRVFLDIYSKDCPLDYITKNIDYAITSFAVSALPVKRNGEHSYLSYLYVSGRRARSLYSKLKALGYTDKMRLTQSGIRALQAASQKGRNIHI